ncbi:MAG: hypothetical protein HYV07_22900 [Deltaproteobacteria bacterium]|nr:hypothetical protein [Deltaproteobacteria bacterium]
MPSRFFLTRFDHASSHRALFAWGVLAACAPPGRIDLEAADVPAGWVGFLLLDGAGELVGSTGLAAHAEGAVTLAEADSVSSSAERVVTVAWSSQALGDTFPPDELELFASALTRASSADIALPEPDWSHAGPIGGGLAEQPAPFPIGAEWLPACDDQFDGSGDCEKIDLIAEIECGEGPMKCGALLRQEGCDFELDGSDCGVGKLVGAVARRDAVCVPETAQHGCARGPSGGFACKNGELTCSARLRPRQPQAAISLGRRFQVLDVEPQDPYTISRGIQHFGQIEAGYLSDLAVNGELLAVTTFDGKYRDGPDTFSGRLMIYRASDLELVDSATTPVGLRRVVRDPSSDGFVLAFDAPLRVARTDARGKITALREIPIDPTLRATPNAIVFATSLAASATEIGLTALVDPRAPTGSEEERMPASVVRILDPETLETILSRDVRQSRLLHIERASGDPEWVISDDFANSVMSMSSLDLTTRYQVELHPRLAALSVDTLTQAPAVSTVVVPALGREDAIHVLTRGEEEGRSGFFEPMATPTAVQSWPADRGLAIVIALDADLEGHAALFDAAIARFLPGSVALGRGAVRKLVETQEGHLLALLPWSAELLEITPASP